MYLPIMLNSIVHVLVYLHYVLAALGKHSMWSPYLTQLQLTQFVVGTRSAWKAAFFVALSCLVFPPFARQVIQDLACRIHCCRRYDIYI